MVKIAIFNGEMAGKPSKKKITSNPDSAAKRQGLVVEDHILTFNLVFRALVATFCSHHLVAKVERSRQYEFIMWYVGINVGNSQCRGIFTSI